MKVAVNTTTKTIVDILPDSATESHKFLVNNNYKLLDVEDPMIGGGFRELTYDELLPIQTVEWKANRELLVSQIEVEYNGHIYQGDETSQDRMSRSLNGLPENSSIDWKTKDNLKVSLSKSDLKEILFLAGQEQTRIWFENVPTIQGATI